MLLESAESSLKQTIQASCAIGIAGTLASNVKKKAVPYSNGEKRTIQTRSDTLSGRHFLPKLITYAEHKAFHDQPASREPG